MPSDKQDKSDLRARLGLQKDKKSPPSMEIKRDGGPTVDRMAPSPQTSQPITPIEPYAEERTDLSGIKQIFDVGKEKQKKFFIALAIVIFIVGAVPTFFCSRILIQRKWYNQKIDDAKRLVKVIEEYETHLLDYEKVFKEVLLNFTRVNWEANQKFKKFLVDKFKPLQLADILSQNLILGKVTSDVNMFYLELMTLFKQSKDHVEITLHRDKKQLEKLDQVTKVFELAKKREFGVVLTKSEDETIHRGRLVIIDKVGEIVEDKKKKNKKREVTIKDLSEKETLKVDGDSVVRLSKTSILMSSGPNVFHLYMSRIHEIRNTLEKLKNSLPPLLKELRKTASYSKVISI